ncbi:MAG: GDP-mannose 4,6-dehydratase [Acidobacteriota bacterium]
MKCFVTGAGGFAGSALRRLLDEQGHQVSGGVFSRTRPGPGNLVACDLLDYGALADLLGKSQPDVVFHLAAQSSPSQSWRQPLQFFENNVQGTVHLLEAVRIRCPQARVLLVSSSQIYAAPLAGQKLKEDSPLDSPNPYACSKRMAEMAAEQYWKSFAVRVIIARPFNHSGPGQSESFVISDFCRQAAMLERQAGRQGESVIRVGSLAPVRDFLDVRDAVRAYLLLALKGEEGQAYNVCSGKGNAIQAILDAVLSQLRVKIAVRHEAARQRKRDHPCLVGDNTKLRQVGSWLPQIPLQQTIRETLEYWRCSEKGAVS